DGAPTTEFPLVAVVEVAETVEVVEVPADRGVLAIDLEGVERLVSPGVPGRLKQAERPIREVAEERAGVVDLHRFDLAGPGVLPLLDKGLGHRRDVADRAVEPQRRVDAVCKEITRHAGAGRGSVEAP